MNTQVWRDVKDVCEHLETHRSMLAMRNADLEKALAENESLRKTVAEKDARIEHQMGIIAQRDNTITRLIQDGPVHPKE